MVDGRGKVPSRGPIIVAWLPELGLVAILAILLAVTGTWCR
jgi:hypothetical protein